jgi:tetratricopeptide (TPR) repeat protein
MSVFNLSVNLGGTSRQSNIIGIPPEQLAALMGQHEDHSETQRKLIARLERDLDLNERQMREALRILGENDVPDEHLGAKLVEIAGHFENLRLGASVDPGESPAIVALKSDVQKAIDAGELVKADALLEDVARAQSYSVERSAISLAGTLARRAEIALTRLHYGEAAAHFASAAAVLPSAMEHDGERISYLIGEASALSQQGDEFGDNAALLSAIERLQRLVTLTPRARVPLSWAMAQNNLSNALVRLGERESGTARLEEAVVALRSVLEERTRARVPLYWAKTLNNLGNALTTLGERESGTARLEEAVVAFRAALEERTRPRVPLAWAGTQNNLGTALAMLGERESGTARLEEAVVAFRAALEEWTVEATSYWHERSQRNLAHCLALLEQRRKQ